MSFSHEVLTANFETAVGQGKPNDNPVNRFNEFMQAVKQTRIEEGKIEHLDTITNSFKKRLHTETTSWGRNIVRDMLVETIETTLNEAKAATA